MSEGRFSDVIEYVDRYEFASGADKTMSLEQAIRENIRPGMSIHVGVTHAFPYAACNEISRAFRGRAPGFTVYSIGSVIHIIIWLRGGLVKHLVTTYCGDIYPAPGPNPAFNEAYTSGNVKISNWSVLTYTLRMMAGALGWPFVPTRSLIGSGMEQENADEIRVVEDSSDGKIALLSPVKPDVSIYHAWAADKSGNAIFVPPYSENLWGAMAAKDGAVITCERIVDEDFIRKHNTYARLPGKYVKAVVHCPMGAHPGGYYSAGLDGLEPYAEDYDFIVEFRKASRKPERMSEWLGKWVYGVKDHGDYLAKLGNSKIALLREKAGPEYWRKEMADFDASLSDSLDWNRLEFMTIAAAREIRKKVEGNSYSMILAGQGNSNLAAWMARYSLTEAGVPCELVAETGFFGYTPRPGSPFLFNFSNIPSCVMLTDVLQTLGVFVGGSSSNCVGSLSAGQVDSKGNINSTCIPGAFYLVGSGGANDVASSAREVIITIPMSPMRCLEDVPYITAPGTIVRTIVTDRGILRRADDGVFELSEVLSGKDGINDLDALIADAVQNCGWNLRVAVDVHIVPPPTLKELKTLRSFDPRRAFTGDT